MESNYLNKILNSLIEGNSMAFSQLYDMFYLRVYRFTSYFIRCREDREEVVSEVFKIIWQNKHLLFGINNFESYLYVVTRNESYKLLRNNNKFQNISIDEMPVNLVLSEQSVENGIIEREVMEVYKQAVDELPERCKLIFLMVREERLRYKEIAEILSISEGTIERQINIATKKIVEIVGKQLPTLKLKKRTSNDCR